MLRVDSGEDGVSKTSTNLDEVIVELKQVD